MTSSRIDSHQHFWDPVRLPYPWMPKPPSVLQRAYLPPELAPILERNRFDGSIVVQATTVPEEAEWLLGLADQYPWIRGVVAWVDLTDPRLGDRLDGLQRHSRFVGVRHPVHDERDRNWLLREDVGRGLAELERRGIPYDLLLYPKHLPLVPVLAERYPKLAMVIDHLAKPPIASGRLEGWAEDLARAAVIPQVFVKLSGMVTEADPRNWSAEAVRPYLQHALACFGAERSMFGSDWPVCTQLATWKEVLAIFMQACGPLPQATREELLGGAASRFYRLR